MYVFYCTRPVRLSSARFPFPLELGRCRWIRLRWMEQIGRLGPSGATDDGSWVD